MKKITLNQCTTLICSIIILLLSSCKKDDDQLKPGVKMTFPSGWQVTEHPGNKIILIGKSPKEDENDNFLENINVSKEPANGISLESHYNTLIKELKNHLNYKFVSSTDVSINGIESKKLIFTATLLGFDLKFMGFMLQADNYTYLITCTAKESTFSKYKELFESIVNTFKII